LYHFDVLKNRQEFPEDGAFKHRNALEL